MGNKPRRGTEPHPNEECDAKKQYLSPAAASTLVSSSAPFDADNFFNNNDAVPAPLAASPNSSAPSSPKSSVAGDADTSLLDANNNNNNDASHGKSACSNSQEEDPYADVRERMEELSSRDKMRHVYHEKGASSAASSDSIVRSPHPDITIFAAITTYLGYVVLIVTGHVRDVCAKIFQKGRYFRSNKMSGNNAQEEEQPPGNYPSDDFTKYAPLLKSWENFYTRRLYHRIQDCFNRPIASRPSAIISVLERVSFDGNKTMSVLGQLSNLDDEKRAIEYQSGEHYNETPDGRVVRKCLNLGSYNYLGFADDWDITCRKDVMGSLAALPSSVGSSRLEFGTTSLHRKVEQIVADFCGKEDAVVLNMGFNTNATIIPTLTSRGDLIVSDELNHTSIVNGARASGAAIRTFRHNDADDLEQILREAIVYGQPRTRRPWNRILVVVEGIYSMEGEYCDLRNVVTVCKKYGAYVYLDEAHSIGAMGPTGRGCCEYTGVDPADVDVLMGTFTKSFGGMGGYVAADRRVIDELRKECAGSAYHNSLSPVVCQQIISSFQVIMGDDGTNIGKRKLDGLRDNSNYFRMRLTDMGLHVLGNYDSPIMPVMLYNPTKIAAFSRECLKRGLAVVVVGFPAVPILMSRARFCISAGHTREELDRALKELDEIADLLKLRYARSTFG
mmetsp:Transcript_29462/g.62544  ORF Transcript_29462/g.62544 Transcript_29462/m.62544 type:complete len:673 (-) Transcript_29462:164-2182(-)|eukprot:CAMPEP_0172302266 /NCGR_PEP_ID=MMETSP1058-20130122/3995_1 /TAXON_ID=83371 /ORGANISM="Detonula confervacea, Strain CCMP 353" /LENGTH=672 /DNA_ID=CAMNT_0013012687 /DNA_START=131 /DNA_END=2149 /DNA_ORIENTATION=+